MKHTIREELGGVVAFVAVVWAVFLLSCVLRGVELNAYGLRPRTAVGLVGVVTMPFLHVSLGHLVSNTVPLFILLVLLAGSRARSWEVLLEISLLGGGLLWIFGRAAVDGRSTIHVGASGMVFGLAAFLIVSGLLEKRLIPLLVSLFVGFLYGGTLLTGVLPIGSPHVSWEGHLTGAVAGVMVACALAREPKPKELTVERSEP